MRKATAIFFLFFFCLSQTGLLVIYHLQRWQIKEQVKKEILAGVPDSYLVVFEYTENIQWEEEGREFRVNGEFFDVVRSRVVNGRNLLYCINDKEEEDLVKRFADLMRSSAEDQKGKHSKQAFKFHLIGEYKGNICTSLPFVKDIIKIYFIYKTAVVSLSREILIPPPWC